MWRHCTKAGLWEDASALMIGRMSTQFDLLTFIKAELSAEYDRVLDLRPQKGSRPLCQNISRDVVGGNRNLEVTDFGS